MRHLRTTSKIKDSDSSAKLKTSRFSRLKIYKKQRKLALQKIEQQLLPRLGILGGILLTFSICSLVYGFFAHPLSSMNENLPQTELQAQGMNLDLIKVGEDDPKTLLPEDILNFYFISLIFGAIGFFCVFTSWKRKHLMQKPQ